MYQCVRHISLDGSISQLHRGIAHRSAPDRNVLSWPRGPRPRPPVTARAASRLVIVDPPSRHSRDRRDGSFAPRTGTPTISACHDGVVATIVCFNAHPDDEALLTGGTIAKLAAEGHRVVLVVATDGIMGTAESVRQNTSRLDELRASARVLGAAGVVHLGYADSGHGPVLYPDPPDRQRFARADTGEAAARLAVILRDQAADLLLSYDKHGGYGHRDHVKVHEVGSLAADSSPASACWRRPGRASRSSGSSCCSVRCGWWSGTTSTPRARTSPRGLELTHRLNVRKYARQKRAALAAHGSQLWPASPGRSGRMFWLLSRLPVPVFGLLLGTEWFAEPGSPPGTHVPG